MRRKILIGIGVVALIGIMVTINVLSNTNDSDGRSLTIAQGPAQEVIATAVDYGTISSSFLVTGTVREKDKTTVRLENSIIIPRVLVDEGDKVSIGQQLFETDTDELENQLAKLQLEYEVQTLSLQRLEAVSPESDLRSMEVSLELARLALVTAQRRQVEAMEDLERYQQLFDKGAIAKSELETYESALTEADSALASARLDLERSSANLSASRDSSDSNRTFTSIDIEIQLKNLKSMDKDIQDLENKIHKIEEAGKATMDGVITSIEIEDGDMPQSMMPILTITDMSMLEVSVGVREYDLRTLALGQVVKVTGDAIEKNAMVMGEISYIAPIAEALIINGRETTAVEVTVAITEGVDLLKPGYTAECEIVTEEIADAILVGYEMLTTDKDGDDMVFVVQEDMTVREQTVELGVTSDFDAQVISGLEVGDKVVMNPPLTLSDGARVRLNEDSEEEGK